MVRKVLIDLDLVRQLTWTKSSGSKLRNLRRERGFRGRRQLAQHLKGLGIPVSESGIQQLETGDHHWVYTLPLTHLCRGLECSLTDLIPSIEVIDHA